jgi:FKBP-type peptidyl-prolyl cis-trans isomerase FkpA
MEMFLNNRRAPLVALSALLLAWTVSAGAGAEVPDPTMPAAGATRPRAPLDAAEQDRALYALGVMISRNLDEFDLSSADFERVKSGLTDGFNHQASGVDLTKDGTKIQMLRRERMARLHEKREQAAQGFLDRLASAKGAQRTANGVVYLPLKNGKGASPGPDDRVTVNYEGHLIDGTVFDGSRERGGPSTFSLRGVIPCWSQALPLMKVGSTSRIVCPAALAYGAHGEPPRVGPDAALDFEVELLAVTRADPTGSPGSHAEGRP